MFSCYDLLPLPTAFHCTSQRRVILNPWVSRRKRKRQEKIEWVVWYFQFFMQFLWINMNYYNTCFLLLSLLFLLGYNCFNNDMLVSVVQQSQSAICLHTSLPSETSFLMYRNSSYSVRDSHFTPAEFDHIFPRYKELGHGYNQIVPFSYPRPLTISE